MALLGTFIDRTQNISQTGANAIQAIAHSLGTTPDAVFVQLRSQAIGSVMPILAVGQNASQSSVGGVGTTTSLYDVFSIYFQTIVR